MLLMVGTILLLFINNLTISILFFSIAIFNAVVLNYLTKNYIREKNNSKLYSNNWNKLNEKLGNKEILWKVENKNAVKIWKIKFHKKK